MSSRPRRRGAARATGRFAQSLALLVSFVLIAGVAGVLAGGLLLPGVALASGTTNLTVQAFDDLPTDLNLTQLPQKSVILASDGTPLATFYDQNRVIVSLSDIAPIMQKAVISIEDKRFYEHGGIDPQGMLRAFATGALTTETQGASTLTQQYIKNVEIQNAEMIEDPAQRQAAIDAATIDTKDAAGYARKLREAKLAISLEQKMSKNQILEAYLNIAQFGANSIYGVEAAAESYFGVHAKDVTYLQAATIAGITQNPSAYDPTLHPAASQHRRDTVLGTMYDQGYITHAQYEAGIATPLPTTLDPHPVAQGCMTADKTVPGAGYFCDYVTKVILNDPAFGATSAAREELLYRGGLTITTTLVPSEEAQAVAAVDKGVPPNDPSGIGAAIASVQPGTGQITSMAQNRTYSVSPDPGPGQTAVDWNTAQAYGGSAGFAPGSSFKVFTLIEWLKQGHSLSETVDGSSRTIDQHEFTACGQPYASHQTWRPGNSEGSGGIETVLNATKNSVNTAFVAMGLQLDLCNIMQDAADLGVVQPGGANVGQNIAAQPSNIIGSANVTPLAMAGAYAAIADNGTFCKPIAIKQVVNMSGKSLPVPSADCQEKLEPRIASAVTYALQTVFHGTAANLGVPAYPAAGKTGTTSLNENNWFVGYTPLKATAVWVGHPNAFKSMHGLTINGRSYVGRSAGPYGAETAGPIWLQFMNADMKGQKVPNFAQAGSTEIFGVQVPVPYVVGMMQADATNALTAAGLRVSVDKNQVTDYHPAGTVMAQSVNGTAPKNSIVVIAVSNGQGAPPAPTCIPGGQWDAACGPQPTTPPDNGAGTDNGAGAGNGGTAPGNGSQDQGTGNAGGNG